MIMSKWPTVKRSGRWYSAELRALAQLRWLCTVCRRALVHTSTGGGAGNWWRTLEPKSE